MRDAGERPLHDFNARKQPDVQKRGAAFKDTLEFESVLPRPLRVLVKRGILLHPTEKKIESLTAFGTDPRISAVRIFLVASMISGGARA